MIKIKINGKTTEVEENTTILEAAREAGAMIPTLCDHPMVKPIGQCRVCVTEIKVKGKSKIVTACNYPIRESIEINTKSKKALKERALTLEVMLSRWPNVKAVKLLAAAAGVKKARFDHPNKTTSKETCILCGRCVRACSEGMCEDIIGFKGRGDKRQVAMPFDKQYERCVGCGTCADVCPTGAIKISDEFNNPRDAALISKWGTKVTEEMATLDSGQCRMREVGTANIIDVMSEYDLLPTHNYKYGTHKEAPKIYANVFRDNFIRQNIDDGCWLGCAMACAKGADNFKLRTGPYKGTSVLVDGPEYENAAGLGSNMGIWEPWAILEMNFYCDTYGIDTIGFGTSGAFAFECYEKGILNKKRTGGLELKWGNSTAALEMLHQISKGKGFGMTLGQGIRRMKEKFAKEYKADPKLLNDIGMEVKGLEYSEYVCKESLAQQGGYAMALKGPQHDEAWLIFMDMVNKQIPTFKDKADALHYFPMFRTWFGLMGLCKLPWNDVTPKTNALTKEPHKIPAHVEGYCKAYEGMTGIKMTPDLLIRQSERVYNFQKCFGLRLGKSTWVDDVPPYRSMGPVTVEEYKSRQKRYDDQFKTILKIDPKKLSLEERIKVLREYRFEQYSKLMDAVYEKRGWDRNGIPKDAHLKKLGIDFPYVMKAVKKARKWVTERPAKLDQ